MKLLAIAHLLFSLFSPSPDQPDTLVSCRYRGTDFSVVAADLSRATGTRIFYRHDWVAGVNVTVEAENIPLTEALRRCLDATPLTVHRWNGSLVVMPGPPLPDKLPGYNPPLSEQDSGKHTPTVLTESEQRYLTGRKAEALPVIRVGRPGTRSKSGNVNIRATVTDGQSGEALIGATMYLDETGNGAATDLHGSLSMLLRPGTYTATFAFMGMESYRVVLEVLSGGEFAIEMKKSAIQMKEIIVYGDRQMNIRFKDPGLEKLNIKAIKEIPMLMGERDILRVSEMMPGIVTVGEASSGLNVRGGNYDQNAFYINRIPIYNTSHLFGFFPAFNADIIKDFTIYKGHIPARWGGQLSSVFNIIGRQGNRKRFSGRASISPVAASLTVEGPLKKEKSSILLSGRYLYSDWILRRINDPVIRESKAGFNDFSLSLNSEINKTQASLFLYHSGDEFSLKDMTSISYSTNGIAVALTGNLSPAVRLDAGLVGSQYRFRTVDRQEPVRAYDYAFQIGDYRLTADLNHATGLRNTLQYGASLTWFEIDRGTVRPWGEKSLRIPMDLGNDRGIETALYLSDTYDPFPWLNIQGGIRFTLFNPLGPRDVYRYFPGSPKDARYIRDTLHFSGGEAIRWYGEPDLRLALNFRTDTEGTVKLSFNQMHQNLFVLNNSVALAPFSQWKLADYHLPPALSRQVSAGVFRTFGSSGWESSVEFYYKRTLNYPEFVDGADFLGTPQVERTLLPGKQNAYGLEFLLRKGGRKLEGWLSYTFSRSFVRVNGDAEWEKINNGLTYPANYDIPHVLNAVINYHFGRRVTASGVITYQTGRPVTYPVSVYYINSTPYVDYSARNEYRIPDYFRTDLSVTLEGGLKRNKLMHYSLVFSVYNVTGRENASSVYFTLENGNIRSYRYSVIGVPVFTVALLLKLGNYATD